MAPEPKKKDPRKQLLKPLVGSKGFQGVTGLHPVMQGVKPMGKSPGVVSAGDATSDWAAGTAPRGRPVSNLGSYLLKPTPDAPTGIEMLNDKPDLINQVQDQYLKAFQLPPALQPKYLRKPEVMDRQRAKAISKGWARTEEPALMLSHGQFKSLAAAVNNPDIGGFTVATEGSMAGQSPPDRFLVGTQKHGQTPTPLPVSAEHIQQYAESKKGVLSRRERFLGSWGEAGMAHNDISQGYKTTPTGETTARRVALRENQEAYGVTGSEGEYMGTVNNPFHPKMYSGDIVPPPPTAEHKRIWAEMPSRTRTTSREALQRQRDLGR